MRWLPFATKWRKARLFQLRHTVSFKALSQMYKGENCIAAECEAAMVSLLSQLKQNRSMV